MDGDRGLRTSAGKFQGGVLYVNQDNPLGVKPKAPRMVKAKDMHKPEVRCPHPAPDPPAKRFPVDTARVGSAQGKAFKGKFDKKFVNEKVALSRFVALSASLTRRVSLLQASKRGGGGKKKRKKKR